MIVGIFFIVLTASRGIHTIPHRLVFPSSTFVSLQNRSPSSEDAQALKSIANERWIEKMESFYAHILKKSQSQLASAEEDYTEGITSKPSVPNGNNNEKYEAKRSVNDSLADNYVSIYSGNSSADNADSDSNVYEYPEIYVNGKTNVTNERIRLEPEISINVTTVSQGFVAKRNSSNGDAPGVSGQMSNSSDEVDKPLQSNLSGKTEKTADSLNETENSTEMVLEKVNGLSESSDSTTNSHIHSAKALLAKGNQFLDKSAADFKKVLTTCPHCDLAEYFSKQDRELAHSLNERSIEEDKNKTITSIEKDDIRTEMASNSSLNSTSEPNHTPPTSTHLDQNPTQKSEESATGTLKNVPNSEIKNHTDQPPITTEGNGKESKLDEKVHPTKMPMLEGEKNEKHDHAKVNNTTSTVGQQPVKESQTTSGHTKIENPPDKKGRITNKEKAQLGNLFRLHDMDEEEKQALLGDNGKKSNDVQMSNSTSEVAAKELQATPAASEDDETAEERDSSIKEAMNWQGNERMDSINGLRRGSLKSQMSLDDMDVRNLGDNSIVDGDDEDVAGIGEVNDLPSSGMMNQVSFASLFIALLSFHWFLQCSGTVLSALSSDFARSAMDLDSDLHYFDNPQ